jgi:pyridoxine/pyridoxamine 5'-phosphate oxidase
MIKISQKRSKRAVLKARLKSLFRRGPGETYTFRCPRPWCGYGLQSKNEEFVRITALHHKRVYHKGDGGFKTWPES